MTPTTSPTEAAGDDWRLSWPHGWLAVQPLGAMLGPVSFQLDGGRTVQPMYRAPWHGADDPALAAAPLLRHLNGDWLCLPFGPSGPHPALPAGWTPRPEAPEEAGQDHGAIANRRWTLLRREPHALVLALELPEPHVLARVERRIAVDPDAPRVTITHTLTPRRDAVLPVALHPTLAVPAGGLELLPGPHRAAHAYPLDPAAGPADDDGPHRGTPVTSTPVRPAGATATTPVATHHPSIPAQAGPTGVPTPPTHRRTPTLHPGATAAHLADLPTPAGTPHRLMRLPTTTPAEALVQLQDCHPPFALRWHGDGPGERPVRLELDWDAEHLPDLLLWISQGGRSHAPWNGRNQALGLEPCASCFDLTRVAEPPADHPLAHRRGLALRAGEPLVLRWSISARLDG